MDDFAVIEVRDKYVALDGECVEPDFSEPDFAAAQLESDEEWEMHRYERVTGFPLSSHILIALQKQYG